MLLAGKVAIVTGAASPRGLGKATARRLAAEGARCALLDLDAEAARRAAADLGPAHRGWACDVTDRERCRVVAAEVLSELGGLDILVNNAGITDPSRLMEIEPARYEAVLDANLRGTLYMSQAVVPHFRSQRAGAIINISSVSAERGGGIFGGPHYSAAKAAILGLTKDMARELGPEGIRVNAVAPGLVDTDITKGALTEKLKGEIAAGIPLRRLGAAEDVAGCCLFLASPLAAYVTGATLDVNGGLHMH